ncbi:MAG: [protein-PII] uridylyltransferase [Gammaproteobacteria bacterium]|nr:[protein-PII] uridylyltransferase [Gammaproteobacteria bacterium]
MAAAGQELAELRAELARSMTLGEDPLAAGKAYLKAGQEALEQAFDAGEDVEVLVHARATQLDALLQDFWQASGLDHRLCLCAVGGYGRGELHPHSDIDLLVLTEATLDAASREKLEVFLTRLWDLGLEIGHAVRSVAECAAQAAADITICTNLLEARALAGNDRLFAAMVEATGPDRIFPAGEFFEAKFNEQKQRHYKTLSSAYKLEPNLKSSPGGLRDLQTIAWVLKRHYGAKTLHELVHLGYLTESEYLALSSCQAYLWKLRFGLHLVAGRGEDRLLFDYQRLLAARLGYEDQENSLGIEQMMKRYYRSVMQIRELNDMLLNLFAEDILKRDADAPLVQLDEHFQLRGDVIEAREPELFTRQPAALLEIFCHVAENGKIRAIRASTLRCIRDALPLVDAAYRAKPEHHALFLRLLRGRKGLDKALALIKRYGVLAAYIPDFARITGQMQYDMFHVYTVDEHTLFLLLNIYRFSKPEHAEEFPLASQTLAKLEKPELVYLAALFHDIGKGRGGDHSVFGELDALAFCQSQGLSEHDARLVAWLVRQHLSLSKTAQSKDISDPDVVNAFARKVGDQMHLDYIYVLTVADIRATNESLWNSWKDALLRDLYHATKRALRRGLENPINRAERIADVQLDAKTLLDAARLPSREVEQLWAQWGEDYFLKYSASQVAWHTMGILRHDARGEPLVMLRKHASEGGTEIFVYIRDQDQLFAAITTLLAQKGLSILDATVHTAQNGYCLDSFVVLDEDGQPVNDPRRIKSVEKLLEKELRHVDQCPLVLQRRTPRRFAHFSVKTTVTFLPELQNGRTAMEVIALDRPGLLSRIGHAFRAHGVRLHNAKIVTLGEKVEDMFFISDQDDAPFTDAAKQDALRATIQHYLDDAEALDTKGRHNAA